MISPLTVDQFQDKLHSLCDQAANGFDLGYGIPVFGSYERKYFYGRITDKEFALKRNSHFGKNSYRIEGTFTASESGKTNVTYQLTYDKFPFWSLRLGPFIVCLLVDIYLYIKTDIPLEGLLTLNAIMLLSLIYVALDIYRGRKMLKTFKEELNIS